MTWWRRLRRGAELDRHLDAELRDHLERHIADHVASGMSPEEARRRAILALGGLESVKEACRDERRTRWAEEFLIDLRYAGRLLRKHAAFAWVAIVSLALGIGANAAIFSLIDAVLLKTLPVQAPQDLVLLRERAGSREVLSWSLAQFRSFQQSQALTGLCAFRPRLDFTVMTPSGAESVAGQLASGTCFDTIGIPMALGRRLAPADDVPGAPPVAAIGYELWRRHFGADPAVIGRIVRIQEQPFTIVGVTAPRFVGLEQGRMVDVSLPLSAQPSNRLLATPSVRWLRLIGRARAGVTRDQVATDLERRRRQLLQLSAAGAEGARLEALSGAQGLTDLRSQFSLSLRLLMVAVSILLLIICANLAALMLARGRARGHELGLRLALGASRHRIARQLLTESLVLSLLGAALGLALASWSTRAIVALLSRGRTPIRIELTPDLPVVGFTIGVTVLASLIFGMWPAFAAARTDLLTPIQGGTRTASGRTRWRSGILVTIQSGLSAVLIIGAVLFARSLLHLHTFDAGFDKNHVLLFNVRPGASGYDRARAGRFFRDLYGSLASAPGVRSATLVMDLPLGGVSYTAGISVPGRPPNPDEQVNYNFVGPRFFQTMGIPILSGRDLEATDDEQARPVALVSQALAKLYFSGRDPLGQRIVAGDAVVEIVGVVKDIPYEGLRVSKERVLYRPWLQDARAVAAPTFAVRSGMPVAALSDLVRQRAREIAPTVPVYSMTTLDAQFDGSIATERLMGNISGFFGVMALLLVGTGVYGTLAHAIAQRTRELGIRLALGATPVQIATLVVAGGLAPVCAGLLVGLPLAVLASRAARSTLFGITAVDPITYGMSTAALLLVAVLAAVPPILSALRADPLVALRES